MNRFIHVVFRNFAFNFVGRENNSYSDSSAKYHYIKKNNVFVNCFSCIEVDYLIFIEKIYMIAFDRVCSK